MIFVLGEILARSSCQKDDNISEMNEKKFVVVKIYNYNNENRLIKKSVTDHLNQN